MPTDRWRRSVARCPPSARGASKRLARPVRRYVRAPVRRRSRRPRHLHPTPTRQRRRRVLRSEHLRICRRPHGRADGSRRRRFEMAAGTGRSGRQPEDRPRGGCSVATMAGRPRPGRQQPRLEAAHCRGKGADPGARGMASVFAAGGVARAGAAAGALLGPARRHAPLLSRPDAGGEGVAAPAGGVIVRRGS